ncbi:MAG: M56 family metallopeptidase [Balneola sp.]|nr:MAG: M56 family metallopeptidase [Balneola sp.]
MIIYLIKSTILLGLLLGLYKLLLENEKMHLFNRFFLLFALAFGLTAPLITFEVKTNTKVAGVDIQQVQSLANEPAEFISESVTPILVPQNEVVSSTPVETTDIQETSTLPAFTLLNAIIFIYGLGVLILFVRLLVGIGEIIKNIRAGEKTKTPSSTLVLLDEAITPQSFLRWVFLSKSDYESGKIGPEIMEHEQTHIRQLHSLDVLLIEILKIVFWFNPVFYWYRNTILLNHEFLADDGALLKSSSTENYQELLLSYSTGKSKAKLESTFGHSSTINRLKMLSKKSSPFKRSAKLFLLMIFLIGVGPACLKTGVQDDNQIPQLARDLVVHIGDDKELRFNDEPTLDSLRIALIRLESQTNLHTAKTSNEKNTQYKIVLSKLNKEFSRKTDSYIEKGLSNDPPSLEELEAEYAYLWGSYSFIVALEGHLTNDSSIRYSSSNYPELVPTPEELLRR